MPPKQRKNKKAQRAPFKRVGNRGKASFNDGKTWSLFSGSMPKSYNPSKYDNQIYSFFQTSHIANALVTSTLVSTFVGINFTMNLVDQVAALQAVFDQYRFNEIEVWIIPKGSSDNKESSLMSSLLYSVIDYDDSAAPANLAALTDFSNCVVSNIADGHYRHFRPHAAVAAYAGAFNSYVNVESPWIDLNSPAVQHYGIKFGCDITAVNVNIDLIVKLSISVRNLR